MPCPDLIESPAYYDSACGWDQIQPMSEFRAFGFLEDESASRSVLRNQLVANIRRSFGSSPELEDLIEYGTVEVIAGCVGALGFCDGARRKVERCVSCIRLFKPEILLHELGVYITEPRSLDIKSCGACSQSRHGDVHRRLEPGRPSPPGNAKACGRQPRRSFCGPEQSTQRTHQCVRPYVSLGFAQPFKPESVRLLDQSSLSSGAGQQESSAAKPNESQVWVVE